jgi:predicted acylesterase/phospholipase RssA
MSRASLLSFLSAAIIAIATVPGRAQDLESRPIDPGAAFAMGNSSTVQTLDRCDPGKKRALVLSGGGLKGAFQAGVTYHLIVHRSCDFSEIAGVSVGSLNAVILAQAQRDENPETSLKNMAGRAEKLVDVWQNIRSSKQILKPRWPGWTWALAARYGLFGTESMNTFDPLMHLIQTNVDMDALDRGAR